MIPTDIKESWLEWQIKHVADAPFIRTENSLFSFEEIGRKVNSLAHHFQNMGVSRQEKVAVISGSKLEIILASLALWQNNNIPVIINLLWSLDQINEVLSDVGIMKIAVQSELKDVVNRISPDITRIYFDFPEISEPGEKQRNFSSMNDALILFTSGSTSKPKGIVFSFDNLFNSFKNMNERYNHSQDDIWLASLPLYHIGGFQIFVRSILSGCSIYIPGKTDIASIESCINEQKITYASFVSTQFKKLVDENVKSPSSFRKVFLGGGPIDTELINKAIALNWPVVKVYGATETSSMVTSIDCSDNQKEIESAGKPFNNVVITIAEKSDGISGEIVVRSASLAKGSINGNESFPLTQNGLYYSGDVGYLNEDGFLYITGRSKRTIISGGENISALEVENVINQHPDIAESFVFADNDAKWGEVPAAVIVFKASARIDLEPVNAYLKENLPTYKCPKRINILFELPKNEMGKIDIVSLMKIVRPG
ncbi:MAG: o-succinylbenzoate--CoA ligase [Bacteroidetes bacterium]|nr:o-succinylbenzoate--CoA ligase [Bacteroidota bacterium]